MKHHLYQLYYGGFKTKLDNAYYCKCGVLIQNLTRHLENFHSNDK